MSILRGHSNGPIGAAGDRLQDVERVVQEFHPDVVMLDFNAPELDPLRVIGLLKEQNPDLKVLVLTAKDDVAYAADLLASDVTQEAGLTGEQVQGDTEQSVYSLTPREREVLTLIGKGADNSEIAWILSISKRTVETHVHNIYVKLGLKRRSQAVLWAVEQGLVDERSYRPRVVGDGHVGDL